MHTPMACGDLICNSPFFRKLMYTNLYASVRTTWHRSIFPVLFHSQPHPFATSVFIYVCFHRQKQSKQYTQFESVGWYVMFTCTGTELNALQREHRLSYHGLDESKDSSTNEALIDPDTVESSRYFISQVCHVIQLVWHGLSCFQF